jgi:hypothetical protein
MNFCQKLRFILGEASSGVDNTGIAEIGGILFLAS